MRSTWNTDAALDGLRSMGFFFFYTIKSQTYTEVRDYGMFAIFKNCSLKRNSILEKSWWTRAPDIDPIGTRFVDPTRHHRQAVGPDPRIQPRNVENVTLTSIYCVVIRVRAATTVAVATFAVWVHFWPSERPKDLPAHSLGQLIGGWDEGRRQRRRVCSNAHNAVIRVFRSETTGPEPNLKTFTFVHG